MLTLLNQVRHVGHGRNNIVMRGARLSAMFGMLSMLVACGHAPKTMYDWQSYQPTVYTYLIDESGDYAVQAQALERNIETSRAANTVLPPGFRAHLGMLYLKMGEDAKAIEQLEGERLAFPESIPFMAFLMRNTTTGATPPSPHALPVGTPPAAETPLKKAATQEGT